MIKARLVSPWRALWAMFVGFFMTLIDSNAILVANPSMMTGLHADYESVIWVTSAYGLGFAAAGGRAAW